MSAKKGKDPNTTKPNIILIVADDMGWADVGYHSSPIQTPQIDRLASEGVVLEQHYVAPMCTPTRAALLTGRYWSRFGNTTPSNERVLPWSTPTLVRALKTVGYATHISGNDLLACDHILRFFISYLLLYINIKKMDL